MTTRLSACIPVLFVFLVASCGGGAGRGEEHDATQSESGEPALPTFMVFLERTDDVAAWNARYEANASVRSTRGMSEVLTAEDIDRPGTIVIIQSVADPDEVAPFVGSEAAVLGKTPEASASTIHMLRLGNMPEAPVAIVIVRERVDDLDAWLREFEEGASARTKAGVHLAGFGRDAGDETQLFQAYFATDLDAARRWASEAHPSAHHPDGAATQRTAPVDSTSVDIAADSTASVVRFVRPIN